MRTSLYGRFIGGYVGDRRVYQSPCMKCDPDRGIGYGMNLSVAGRLLWKQSRMERIHEIKTRLKPFCLRMRHL